MNLSNFQNFPHVRYIPNPNRPEKRVTRYYIGEDVEGLYYTLYSPSFEVERIEVFICIDDDKKIKQVNIDDFGDFSDLRDDKIKKILK